MSTAHKKSDPTTRRIQGYQMETETNPGIYACAVCPNFKPTAEIRGYKEHMRYILILVLDFFRQFSDNQSSCSHRTVFRHFSRIHRIVTYIIHYAAYGLEAFSYHISSNSFRP